MSKPYEVSADVLNNYLQTVIDTHADQQIFVSITRQDHEAVSQDMANNLIHMGNGLESREVSQAISVAAPGQNLAEDYDRLEEMRRTAVNNPVSVASVASFEKTSDAISGELMEEQLNEQKLCEHLGLIKEGLEFMISRGLRNIRFDKNPETIAPYDLPRTIGPQILEMAENTRRENLDLRFQDPIVDQEQSFDIG